MTFTHKLAVIALFSGTLFACSGDGPAGNSAKITRLVVVPNTVTIDLSQPVQLQAYGRTQANDSVATPLGTVSWKTSDAAVASVSASGLVNGIVGGSVTITATSQGVSGVANVSVSQSPLPPPPPRVGWHVSPSGSSSGN